MKRARTVKLTCAYALRAALSAVCAPLLTGGDFDERFSDIDLRTEILFMDPTVFLTDLDFNHSETAGAQHWWWLGRWRHGTPRHAHSFSRSPSLCIYAAGLRLLFDWFKHHASIRQLMPSSLKLSKSYIYAKHTDQIHGFCT